MLKKEKKEMLPGHQVNFLISKNIVVTFTPRTKLGQSKVSLKKISILVSIGLVLIKEKNGQRVTRLRNLLYDFNA